MIINNLFINNDFINVIIMKIIMKIIMITRNIRTFSYKTDKDDDCVIKHLIMIIAVFVSFLDIVIRIIVFK